MLQDYMTSIRNGEQALSQPVLSIIMAGMLAGAAATTTAMIDPTTNKLHFNTPNNTSTANATQPVDPLAKAATHASPIPPVAPLGTETISNIASATNSQAIGVLPVGQQPMADFLNSISKTMQTDFNTVIPQLGLEMVHIASAVMIAAAYWSIPGAITLTSGDAVKDDKTLSKRSAESFAMTVALLVNRPDFNLFVQSRMTQYVSKLNEAQFKLFSVALKVIMLACALAALEKSIMGRCSGEDFLKLLGGKIPLADGDFRISIIQMMHEQLSNLPPHLRAELLESFAGYLDYGPKLEQLYDPTYIFLKMWNPRLLREAPLQHSA
jgi:hypothetical protein